MGYHRTNKQTLQLSLLHHFRNAVNYVPVNAVNYVLLKASYSLKLNLQAVIFAIYA